MAQRRVKGVAIHRPIVYGNSAIYLLPSERKNPDHTHRWTVAVRSAASPAPGKRGEDALTQIGGTDDISTFIKKVSFKLHETYPTPMRVVDKPPFEVTETGWGEFEIQIKIFFVQESNEKPITVHHLLKLHPFTVDKTSKLVVPWVSDPNQPGGQQQQGMDANPVHSWQYDEVVFSEPTEALFANLTQQAATPLPPKPRPSHHPQPLPITSHNGGVFGELSMQAEEAEGKEIDDAKDALLKELEACRTKLTEYEQEIKDLKREVDGQ